MSDKVTVKEYFTVDDQAGLHIYKLGSDGERYMMCTMRWTDGMRPAVEKAVADDAQLIADALNTTLGATRTPPVAELIAALDGIYQCFTCTGNGTELCQTCDKRIAAKEILELDAAIKAGE